MGKDGHDVAVTETARGRGAMYREGRVAAGPLLPDLATDQSVLLPDGLSHQNGFATSWLMRRAHSRVLEAIARIEAQQDTRGVVLDLGCGNGSLLHAVAWRGWGVAGVEADRVRASTARERLGDSAEIVGSSIWEYANLAGADIALIGVARLEENRAFRRHLGQAIKAKRWLVYDYDGRLVERLDVLGVRLDNLVENHVGRVTEW